MLAKVDDEEPLDLVVANAGVLSDTDGITGSQRVLDINVQGSLNTVYPLLDHSIIPKQATETPTL